MGAKTVWTWLEKKTAATVGSDSIRVAKSEAPALWRASTRVVASTAAEKTIAEKNRKLGVHILRVEILMAIRLLARGRLKSQERVEVSKRDRVDRR